MKNNETDHGTGETDKVESSSNRSGKIIDIALERHNTMVQLQGVGSHL